MWFADPVGTARVFVDAQGVVTPPPKVMPIFYRWLLEMQPSGNGWAALLLALIKKMKSAQKIDCFENLAQGGLISAMAWPPSLQKQGFYE